MIYLVAFVVLVLATARLTRLVTKDDLTTSVRRWIDHRFGETSLLARLIYCHWCSAVWISAPASLVLVRALEIFTDISAEQAWLAWILLVPANAYAAAWIVDKEGD